MILQLQLNTRCERYQVFTSGPEYSAVSLSFWNITPGWQPHTFLTGIWNIVGENVVHARTDVVATKLGIILSSYLFLLTSFLGCVPPLRSSPLAA